MSGLKGPVFLSLKLYLKLDEHLMRFYGQSIMVIGKEFGEQLLIFLRSH